MRHHGEPAASASPHSPQPGTTSGKAAQPPAGSDWKTLSRLLPYLWQYKWRVVIALSLMVCAKLANVSVPLLLKELVDAMSLKPGDAQAVLVVPVALLVAYGALRLLTSAFTELRELVFAKATQGASRSIALETFEHLHALSLRFHLARQTGGMTRDIERGVRGIESLISYSLYSVIPTLIQELGEGARPIASKVDELAALKAIRLTPDELSEIARIGNNTGCMALKGSSRRHVGSALPDQWELDSDLEALAARWQIDPDIDLALTHSH